MQSTANASTTIAVFASFPRRLLFFCGNNFWQTRKKNVHAENMIIFEGKNGDGGAVKFHSSWTCSAEYFVCRKILFFKWFLRWRVNRKKLYPIRPIHCKTNPSFGGSLLSFFFFFLVVGAARSFTYDDFIFEHLHCVPVSIHSFNASARVINFTWTIFSPLNKCHCADNWTFCA